LRLIPAVVFLLQNPQTVFSSEFSTLMFSALSFDDVDFQVAQEFKNIS
jgi:hypothetical protein